MFIMEIVKFT